jgi:FixJ family two-component response regulator
VVLISGFVSDPRSLPRGLPARAEFLQKPFSSRQLFDAIEAARRKVSAG